MGWVLASRLQNAPQQCRPPQLGEKATSSWVRTLGGDRVGAGEGPGPRELCLLPASFFRLLSTSFRLGVRPSLSYECLCLMPLEPCLLTA